jgi:hypothetical protein
VNEENPLAAWKSAEESMRAKPGPTLPLKGSIEQEVAIARNHVDGHAALCVSTKRRLDPFAAGRPTLGRANPVLEEIAKDDEARRACDAREESKELLYLGFGFDVEVQISDDSRTGLERDLRQASRARTVSW